MNNIDSSYLLNAENWFVRSSQSVLSHWNSSFKTFIRSTESLDKKFYTSASMHSILALQSIGLWLNTVIINSKVQTPYFVFDTTFSEKAEDMLHAMLNASKDPDVDNWVDFLLINSSHVGQENKETGENKLFEPRTAIVLELVLGAWVAVISNNSALKSNFTQQTHELVARSSELLDSYLKHFDCKPGETPSPISNLTNCILYLKELNYSDENNDALNRLEEIFDQHINYHMARSGSNSTMSFDPVSLATALSGKVKIQSNTTNDLFFQSCLEVIMNAQHPNGCWDDGISITYSSTGDVVQQPSVGVAVAIAEAAIHPSYLLDYDENIGKILKIVLPGLRKTAQYLQDTFQVVNVPDFKIVDGWSSDRTRKKNYSEAWITALVNRFFYRLWIAEKALLRHDSLTKLGIKKFKSTSSKSKTLEDSRSRWDSIVIDPDEITKPTDIVWNKFLMPILQKEIDNQIVVKPDKSGVSLIVYGPPGSGKTFFIEKMSEFIDWPLVEINPGHFIKNGLELIEATTRELFDLLNNLNHAVVFFDECDELFRTRNSETSNARSILSFATASMLPKLQKLHDSHNIIFVLGTNYLSTMDSAIVRPGRFDEIILFDRPDENARKILIDKFPKLSPERKAQILPETNKFTIQEVIAYIKELSGFQSSVIDYEKWCQENGKKEIEASRLGIDQQKAILKKWK